MTQIAFTFTVTFPPFPSFSRIKSTPPPFNFPAHFSSKITSKMSFSIFIFLSIFWIFSWPANAQKEGSLSPCLQRCLEPMTRIEKSISNMYRNYEKVCEKLEWSANCVQSCVPEDRGSFFQFTTFYRIHCIDFEEELEEQLPCLREAAYKADVVCREKCVAKQPEKHMAKAERQKELCKNVECATICYVHELGKGCPAAKETLIRLNVRIADEMRRLTRDEDFANLSTQCQRVQEGEYMRQRLLEMGAKAGGKGI